MERIDPRLATYLEWLERWNVSVGLVSRRLSRAGIERQLVAPILASCRHAGNLHGHLLDVGAGSGMGGVIFALVNPGLRVTFVERNARKAAFIKQVCREIGLAGRTAVCNHDVRELALPEASVDYLFFRGVAGVGQILRSLKAALTANATVLIVLPDSEQSPAGLIERGRHPVGQALALVVACRL